MKAKFIPTLLCICSLIGVSACSDRTEAVPSQTTVTTVSHDLISTADDAYEIAERDLRSRLGMKYHEISYVDIADKTYIQSVCTSTIYAINGGNQYETFNAIDPNGNGVEIIETIDHKCYNITFKGKAYGYVDEYHDDYRTMLFTYNADVILSDGAIENIGLDVVWK